MDYTHEEVRAIIKFVLEEERKQAALDEAEEIATDVKPEEEVESAPDPVVPEEKPAASKPKSEDTKSLKPKSKGGRPKKIIDIGKLIALWEGGWSVKEIAQELGVSEKTVRNNMPEE